MPFFRGKKNLWGTLLDKMSNTFEDSVCFLKTNSPTPSPIRFDWGNKEAMIKIKKKSNKAH